MNELESVEGRGTPETVPDVDRDASPRTAETAAGTTLAYETYGDEDGVPLVFLHGTPGSRLLGGLLDAPARRAGVQVLAPDRHGYGHTGGPGADDFSAGAATVATLADAVDADRVAVAAFSGGAPFALAAAEENPGRVDSLHLVSSAPAPGLVDESETPRVSNGERRTSVRRELPTVTRVLGWLATHAPSIVSAGLRLQSGAVDRFAGASAADQYVTDGSPVEIPPHVEALVDADFLEAFRDGTTGAVADFRLLAAPWSVTPSAIDQPVHLWHGTADENAPVEGARRLAGTLYDADLTEYDDVGHLGALVAAAPRVVESVAT